jgi:crossover junction endodeoxyribonuclease RusA
MPDQISFFVAGDPQPKGSTRAFIVNGRPIITSSNKNLRQWELRIAHEAQAEAYRVRWEYCHEDAFEVEADFYFPLPKSYSKKWHFEHIKRPDLDKIGRALNDALTNILFSDDSQVFTLHLRKRYSDENNPVGVHVKVIRVSGRSKA